MARKSHISGFRSFVSYFNRLSQFLDTRRKWLPAKEILPATKWCTELGVDQGQPIQRADQWINSKDENLKGVGGEGCVARVEWRVLKQTLRQASASKWALRWELRKLVKDSYFRNLKVEIPKVMWSHHFQYRQQQHRSTAKISLFGQKQRNLQFKWLTS